MNNRYPDTDEEPPIVHHFGYGKVGVGICGKCDEVRTLFLHSAIHTTSDSSTPWCATCVANTLSREHHELWEAKMGIREMEGAGEPDSATQERLKELRFKERLYAILSHEWADTYQAHQVSRADILRHEWGCVACAKFWHPDDKRTSHMPTTALDPNGVVITVHTRCTFVCFLCDKVKSINDLREQREWSPIAMGRWDLPVYREVYNEGFACRDCIHTLSQDNDYYMCQCGKLFHEDNSVYGFDQSWCGSCGDAMRSCDYCGDNYWEDDDHDCDEQQDNRIIHSYDWRPRGGFTYHGKDPNNVYLGFELEVEYESDVSSRNLESYAEHIRQVLEIDQNRGFLKYDGSLNHGFEIVSQPHTLDEYQDKFPWEVISDLQASGFRSWDTDTCGLHIHVSKRAFGLDPEVRIQQGRAEAHALRFCKLIYDNQPQVVRLAGRTSDQWASFGDKRNLIRKVKHGQQNNSRYSVVNVSNRDTYEVRAFRGSMRIARLKAQLEFVHAVVEYTRNLKVSPNHNTLKWGFFRGWVLDQPQYANLSTLLSNLPRTISAESEQN